ncbi:Hypothetical protein NGAL_HAMBI2605_62800 [Neorhizobium galegae bv. orientalis]|nr:Hypothetical protein NGAL_HAMBI2605_62800 [Neorhizobium galegae bv. orientalis]
MNPRNDTDTASVAVATPKPSYILPTLKSRGAPSFRSRVARDLGCILDLDPQVENWATRPDPLVIGDELHVADVEAHYLDGTACLIDAPDRVTPVSTDRLKSAAEPRGLRYRLAERREIYSGFRLRNARDLLRYANYSPSLADRLRLLGTLGDQGSLPMADCLRVITGRDPVAVLASMILQGFVDVELDDALLGPETMMRRIRS